MRRKRRKKKWVLMSELSSHMLKYLRTQSIWPETNSTVICPRGYLSNTYIICDHSMKISWIRLKSIHLLNNKNIIIINVIFTSTSRLRYLFLISKLVVYRRLLWRLDLDFLCGCPIRGVTIGQVAHSRVCKLGLFMPINKNGKNNNSWLRI